MGIMRRLVRRFLPGSLRHTLRRHAQARAVARGRFGERGDPFFDRLVELVKAGDWVIDVGAAVGDYAIPLSGIVGARGRVIALEPMAVHFDLLTSNSLAAPHQNITCLQLAAGERVEMVMMRVPMVAGALDWYEARVAPDGDTPVLSIPLDSIPLVGRVTLVKVDAEGHDLHALRGATRLIEKHRPAVLIEADSRHVREWLESRSYTRHSDPLSVNKLYLP